MQIVNGTTFDLFNNQFMESGRLYSDKVEASGFKGRQDQINYAKITWYISIKPLPDIIKENEYVQNDLGSCAA